MKAFLYILFCLLFSGCLNNKQVKEEKSQHPASEKKAGSAIEFQSEMHNFGTLIAGETVAFSFIYENKGDKPLRIKKADISCGCIKVIYKDEELLPGKKSSVEVVLNTSGEWGNLLKTIEIETSFGEKKILTIGAYIENKKFNNLLKKEK